MGTRHQTLHWNTAHCVARWHARCGDTGAAAGCHISALRADLLSWVHFIIYPPPHRVQDTEYMSRNSMHRFRKHMSLKSSEKMKLKWTSAELRS